MDYELWTSVLLLRATAVALSTLQLYQAGIACPEDYKDSSPLSSSKWDKTERQYSLSCNLIILCHFMLSLDTVMLANIHSRDKNQQKILRGRF